MGLGSLEALISDPWSSERSSSCGRWLAANIAVPSASRVFNGAGAAVHA